MAVVALAGFGLINSTLQLLIQIGEMDPTLAFWTGAQNCILIGTI